MRRCEERGDGTRLGEAATSVDQPRRGEERIPHPFSTRKSQKTTLALLHKHPLTTQQLAMTECPLPLSASASALPSAVCCFYCLFLQVAGCCWRQDSRSDLYVKPPRGTSCSTTRTQSNHAHRPIQHPFERTTSAARKINKLCRPHASRKANCTPMLLSRCMNGYASVSESWAQFACFNVHVEAIVMLQSQSEVLHCHPSPHTLSHTVRSHFSRFPFGNNPQESRQTSRRQM